MISPIHSRVFKASLVELRLIESSSDIARSVGSFEPIVRLPSSILSYT